MPSHPDLPEPYAEALLQAEAYLHQTISPLAIIVSGTVVRGTSQASSDLDIVVVHDAAWRQRVQRRFGTVPVEMFINPAFQIHRQMKADASVARPVMAHMLATGHLILDDATGIGAGLQRDARANLAAGPTADSEWLLLRRYRIVTGFEDACDLVEIDPERARALAIQAVIESIEWWFPAHGFWLPRPKILLVEFAAHHPDLADQARAVIRAHHTEATIDLATPIVQHILHATGSFEWESIPQVLSS